MSAIQDISNSNEIPNDLRDFVRETISRLFWEWYQKNKEDKLVTVGWWIFHKTIKLKDLHGVFELLFGPESGIGL